MPKVVGNAGYVSTIRDGYTCVAVSELVRVESGESVFFSKFGKIMFWRRRMGCWGRKTHLHDNAVIIAASDHYLRRQFDPACSLAL